jgi:hypothetical protein
MQKIIHLLLLFLPVHAAHSCISSGELKTKNAAVINSDSKRKTDSAITMGLDNPDTISKPIYVNYTCEKEDPVAFSDQAIKHCKLLKHQKSLDKQAGATPGNPLLVTRKLFPGITLEDISRYLTLIIQSNGNTKTAEKSLLDNLKLESPEQVIKLCNAASYVGIEPLIDVSILFIKKYAVKNIANKNLITLLKDLNPEIQKLITPSMICVHTPSYELLANNSHSKITAQIIQGHTGPTTSESWSPDGTKLASSSWDGTVRIWDAQTGTSIGAPLTGHTHFITSVSWSPDGTKLASSALDNTIRIWDANTGSLIGAPLIGPIGDDYRVTSICSVTWSPDGTQLAAALYDSTSIWNLENLLAKEKQLCSLTIEQAELFMEIASGSSTIALNTEQKKTFSRFPVELKEVLHEKLLQLKQQKQTLIKRVAIATGIVAGGVFAWKCLSKK